MIEHNKSKKRTIIDGITYGGLAPAGGVVLEQLTENVPHYLSDGIRGVSSVGYGFPLIWKEVSRTVTENPTVTTTINSLNHAANTAILIGVVELGCYAGLRLYDKIQSWRSEKKLKKLQESK